MSVLVKKKVNEICCVYYCETCGYAITLREFCVFITEFVLNLIICNRLVYRRCINYQIHRLQLIAFVLFRNNSNNSALQFLVPPN